MIRTTTRAGLELQAVASAAARDARRIVADVRAQYAAHKCGMEASPAARRAPFLESSDEQREVRDLVINADKASGEYDRRRSGGRVGVWA